MKFSLGRFGASRNAANKKKPAIPTRSDILALRPLRNPALEWEEIDGLVVLHITRDKSMNWKMRLAGMVTALPEKRSVELDAIGTDVWLMLDGHATVSSIVKALSKKHKLSQRETELSLQQFFKELGRRGYIGFTLDEPEAE
ncbi:MAG TPA: PqqD family protein [Abditibacteriaceae bacterium]|jgi:hypothetical protein